MLLREAKQILKKNGYILSEANSSFGVINNKRLRKLLDDAGYEDVHLCKGRGFFYVFADNSQHADWLNVLDSTAIYLNSFNQQPPEEWFDNIDYMLRKGHKEFIEYHSDEPIDEDFGIGVGAPVGLDQGIPHGGDCKGVMPVRMQLVKSTGTKADPRHAEPMRASYWMKQAKKAKKRRNRKGR